IRLLELQPGSKDDPLACKLFQTNMDIIEKKDYFRWTEAPEYRAISYTWGDPKKTSILTIGNECLAIGANLSDALRAFRKPERAINLWADAVCI
ncbi:hypothetical protein AOQ84DRAFT_267411, partial [Glonium stellatum]